MQKSKSLALEGFDKTTLLITIAKPDKLINLSFSFNNTGLITVPKAWEKSLTELSKKADLLRTQNCSIFGKAQLVRSIIFSKLSHFADLLSIISTISKKITRIIRKSLWKDRTKIIFC